MSLLLAIDPGASPGRPGCEAKGCPSTSTTSARAYLGWRHPTTIRVCETHRRALEVAGDLENPVRCLIPECGRTRAVSARLCAEHQAVANLAQIKVPKTGVVGAETLLALRTAVQVDEQQRKAAIDAASPAQPRVEEPIPDHMGACWRHLADLVPGGTRIDKAVEHIVADLKRTKSILRETEERRHAAVNIAELRGDEVRAASEALTELGVPVLQADPAEPQYLLVERIRRLAAGRGGAAPGEPVIASPTGWVQLDDKVGKFTGENGLSGNVTLYNGGWQAEIDAPYRESREEAAADRRRMFAAVGVLGAVPMSAEMLQAQAIAACVAVCPTHGRQDTCDEDRCCQTCGRDLIVCADEHSADMLMGALREEAPALAELRAHLRGEPGGLGIADAALVAKHTVRKNAAMVAALDEMRGKVNSLTVEMAEVQAHATARELELVSGQDYAERVYREQLAALRDRVCGTVSGQLLPADDTLVKDAETFWQSTGRQVGHTEALEALSVQLLAYPALRAAVARLWVVPGAPAHLLTRGVEMLDDQDAQTMSRALLGLQEKAND